MNEEVSITTLRAGDEDAWREAFATLNEDVQEIAEAVLSEEDANRLAEETLKKVATPEFLEPLATFEELRLATRALVREKLAERAGRTKDADLGKQVSELYDSPRLLDPLRLGGKPRDEEKWRKVYQALREVLEKNLSERERRVARLFYFDGFGLKSIAHYMSLPLVSVAAAFLKALDKIKQALRNQGIEPLSYLD